MTREWVSDTNHDWVMKCDQRGCSTRSEPFPKQPDLSIFQERGWFVAAKSGDVCPSCLARGVEPTAAPHHRTAPLPEDGRA